MFCKKCGKQLPDNMGSCPYCGAYLAVKPVPYTNVKNNAEYSPKYAANAEKNSMAGLVAAIVILAVLLVSAVAALIIIKPWESIIDKQNTMTVINDDVSDYTENVFSDVENAYSNTEVEATVESYTKADDAADSEVIADDAVADEAVNADEAVVNEVTVVNDETPVVNESDAKAQEFLVRFYEIEAYTRELGENAMTQMQMNAAGVEMYNAWDELLNDVYQYLKSIKSDAEFDAIYNDEVAWIREKEAAMAATAAEWEGGSGQTAAKYGVGADYTKQRCYELIALI